MLYYLPENISLQDFQNDKQVIKIDLASGGFISAEPVDYNQVRINTINSTDPMDYMDARYQPGEILTLEVKRISTRQH